MKLTKLRIIFGLLACVLLIAGFIVYLQFSQRVIDEALELQDQHCIAINPLINRRKQAYIDGMKTIQASGSAGMESYLAYQDQYLAAAKDYRKLEKLWLEQEQAFLNRTDVRLLLPAGYQEIGKYQIENYTSDLKAIGKVIRFLTGKNAATEQALREEIMQAEHEQRLGQQGADLRYASLRQQQLSFRDQFITPPKSQCPEENRNFPDIEQELGV